MAVKLSKVEEDVCAEREVGDSLLGLKNLSLQQPRDVLHLDLCGQKKGGGVEGECIRGIACTTGCSYG